jgi:hypothetical protein
MQMTKYLSATALLAVLAAPAFAQTVIIQDLPGVAQNSGASVSISSPGRLVSSIETQEGTNLANTVGFGGAVGVTSPYSISQTAGAPSISAFGNPLVIQNAANQNSATSTAPALSDVTVGNTQTATNALNFANIATPSGAIGSISQIVSNAAVNASNAMSATAQNGNASVIGAGAGQTANSLFNTGNAVVTTSTDLTIKQRLGDANSLSATNSAIANSLAGSNILDPSVQTLKQSSSVDVNRMSLASSNGAAAVSLTGSQNGTTPQDGVLPDRFQVTVGNTAAAFTGVNNGSYNIGTSNPGNGVSTISGVTQNAGFGLNNVSGGANVSIAMQLNPTPVIDAGPPPYGFAFVPGDGFTQSVDGTFIGNAPGNLGQPVYTPAGNVLGGVVNGIAARTNTGSSSVTGAPATLTQGYSMAINTINTGGSLSGLGTQAAKGIQQTNSVYTQGPLPIGGYANAVVADATFGPATIKDVSQSMDQTINLAKAGGTAPGLALAQTGSDIRLASNNVQVAQGSTSATISGAQQGANSGLNVAILGNVTGTISQSTAGTVALTATNQMASLSAYNASTSGVQVSSTSVNVIK